MSKPLSKQLVVCINNEGYLASLEKRKIYVSLRDPVGEKRGLLRIIDESGDDYLYPKAFFRPIACHTPSRKRCWPLLDRLPGSALKGRHSMKRLCSALAIALAAFALHAGP